MRNLRLLNVLLLLVCAYALAQTPRPLGQNEGEVMDVDKAAGELTIRHGYLPELSMDPMTMVFKVADPALLDGVKNGDYVRFKAGLVKGEFAVISITLLQPRRKESR